MQIFVIIALFFIPFSAINADRNLEKDADTDLRAALFDKAAAEYQDLLRQSPDTGKKREWIQNLALCFYRMQNFSSIPALLEPQMPLSDPERLYLGAAYSHLGRLEEAINILKPSQDGELNAQILLEKGIAFYRWNKFDEAINAFKTISEEYKCFSLAQIHLIKIAIDQKNYALAQEIIDSQPVPQDSPLVYELHYLQGIVGLASQNRALAIAAFAKALPSLKAPWARDTLIHLGHAYLESALEQSDDELFDKAIEALVQANLICITDDVTLALGNAYLSKGSSDSLQKAKALLSNSTSFSNRDTQNQALFLSIQATESFEERDLLYRRLTQEKNAGSPYYGSWWLHRGMHDLSHSQTVEGEMREMLVRRALSAFENAERYLPLHEQPQARIWCGRAYLLENSPAGFEKAKHIFAQLLSAPGTLENPADLYYLYAQALNQGRDVKTQDIEWLGKGLSEHRSEQGVFSLAVLHYKNEEWSKAEALFSSLLKSADHNLRAEALFWAGKCEYALRGTTDKIVQFYTDYPQHPLAPEAYFSAYSYKEYLQGDREAMKHLQQMNTLFPNSIYTLNAYYLTGLDYKRERKSSGGKKIRQRDLNGAIEAFNKVEEKFESLSRNGCIAQDQLEYAKRIYHYAALERALANLTIADQSEGAKQDIFLEYGRELLEKIVGNFRSKGALSPFEEEATYWLAKAYHKGKDIEKSTALLQNMVDQFASVNITRGYFLSRAWNELGTIYLDQRDYRNALSSFEKAEETGKGGILTSDDQLNLWIAKSQCYRGQQDYDNAIRILTQVTHEKVVSGLRLKAMYLRSELYALQNRPELERNQLIALSKKGGEWALKARQALEEKYGY